MSRAEDIAWFAGVFEGEGSVYARKFIRGKNKTLHIHGGFRIQMTDKDVLERIQTITGVGKICDCPPTGLAKKTSWAWQVQNREDFSIVSEMLRPYLGERRKSRLEVIEKQLTWRQEWWRAAA